MKFESKCGIGEIIVTRQTIRADGRVNQDIIGEVLSVIFQKGAEPYYIVRVGGTGLTINCAESEIEGDPAFNQEIGYEPSTDA